MEFDDDRDPGPDDEREEDACEDCGEIALLEEAFDEMLCEPCIIGKSQAAADCAAERRAERRYFCPAEPASYNDD